MVLTSRLFTLLAILFPGTNLYLDYWKMLFVIAIHLIGSQNVFWGFWERTTRLRWAGE